MPLLIENADAFVVVHDSVDAEPVCTDVGEAMRTQVGAGGGGGVAVTMTIAEHVTVPPAPVAVPVYVVLATSAPVVVAPFDTGVSAPMPWLMLNELAFVVVHESVEAEPVRTDVGDAVRTQIGTDGGGGGGSTYMCAEQIVCPPGPETVIV
jgi:hypothetical protein